MNLLPSIRSAGTQQQTKETLDFPFEVKTDSVTEDGKFEGYGSTFGGVPDSYRDVVQPGAFQGTVSRKGRNGNGIALLWQHYSEYPMGGWDEIREDAKGLFMRGALEIEAKPNGIPVYNLLKKGNIKGLSIGFNALKWEYDKNTDIRTLTEIELWEVSLVTFPANKRATVTGVKDVVGAKTPRELERALRDAGLSREAAKHVAGLCRPGLGTGPREAGGTGGEENALLRGLREVNAGLRVYTNLNL